MEEERSLKMSRTQFTKTFGKRNDLILKELVPHIEEEISKKWAKRKEEIFRELARGKLTLMKGMEPFLETLKAQGIPRIIASSTPPENLHMFLTSTILGNYFSHYVSAEEVLHGKPAPDVFIAAANQLGFDPKNCIVIEDSPAGLQAGRAAGCFVIALETSHPREDLFSYDLVYPSGDELSLQEILDRFKVWKKTVCENIGDRGLASS